MNSISQVNSRAARFLDGERRMLIGGEWMDAQSKETLEAYNPASGVVIAKVPAGDAADIDRAVKAAREAFNSEVWWKLGPDARGRILWRIGELIDAHVDELAELEALNNGMSFGVAKAFGLPHVAETFRYYAGWATKLHGRTAELRGGAFNGLGYTLREPVGVAGLITPWNAPLLIAGWQLAPALTAGCACVLKPAEETPLTALRLGELLIEAGLPAGMVNIVTGFGHTAGAALAAHPDVDKIAFTGSTEVGRLILDAAAGNLKKVSLELGGKSPVVILDDADFDKAVPGASRAIFNNAGQICSAGSRLYVQKRSYDRVVEGVAEFARKLQVGPGMDPASQMGPLVSAKQLERVTGYIESGIEEGARVVTGGGRIGERGYFVEPTVLTGAKQDMRIVREEIFGPVLCAMPFEDIDEVAAVANDTTFGLAASVWTNDVSKAHSLVRKIKAGSIGINCHSAISVSMPRGGYKQSGWGRENGPEALENYLETKSVFVAL